MRDNRPSGAAIRRNRPSAMALPAKPAAGYWVTQSCVLGLDVAVGTARFQVGKYAPCDFRWQTYAFPSRPALAPLIPVVQRVEGALMRTLLVGAELFGSLGLLFRSQKANVSDFQHGPDFG